MFSEDWVINLAILFIVVFVIYSLYKVYFKGRKDKTGKNISELEKIYFDVMFLLNFPFMEKSMEKSSSLYMNDDKKMESAVNDYLRGGTVSGIPEEKVFEEAVKFRRSQSKELTASGEISASPISFYDNNEVKEKASGVLEYINANLYSFSRKIENLLNEVNSTDPDELFQRNRELMDKPDDDETEYPDPYLALFRQVRKEYEELLKKRAQ